jgi:hypothetical protein
VKRATDRLMQAAPCFRGIFPALVWFVGVEAKTTTSKGEQRASILGN